MRAVPQAIIDALSAGHGTPTVTVSSNDLQTRLATLSPLGPAARTAAVLTAAKTILRAAVSQSADPNSLTVYRITQPALAAQWNAPGTVLAVDVHAAAGCCLVQTGSIIRLFYWATGGSIVYRDSSDDGQTWGAETAVLPAYPGTTVCTGITAASTTDLYAAWYTFPQAASVLARTRFTSSWSAWSGTGPTSPAWGQLRGIAIDASSEPAVLVAGVQMRAQRSGIACAAATFDGTTWSAWTALMDMDTPNNGLSLSNPTVHFNAADGFYYAAANLQDAGSVSGTVQNRITVWRSTDGSSWQLAQTVGNVWQNEAHWLLIAGNAYAFDNTSVHIGPAPAAPSDLTADLLSLHISETSDAPSKLTLVLANDRGQYLNHPALRDNAQVAIGLGYNGVSVDTHTGYIDAVEYRCTPDSNVCIVNCRDLAKYLDQICTKLTSLAGDTVGQIAIKVCALANVSLAALPGGAQFGTVIPCFVVVPGETWYAALKRLGSVYDFEIMTRTPAEISIRERLAGEPSGWSYGQETLGVAWQQSADQPNIVRVVGSSSTSSNIFAEVQDAANLAASGAHRYQHVVERMCDTAAKCLLAAQLALRDDQTQSQTGSLTVSINPQHEVLDVITITDARVGLASQRARIRSIQTLVDWQHGVWEQRLGLELP
ncbi:MAG: hypothetical protein ACRDFX_11320 [Chloroflexota bacterium]